MRVSHVYECPPSKAVRSVFKDLISGSHAVDISRHAAHAVPGGRLAVEASTYDRFVEWNSSAMRRHMEFHEAKSRCENLVRACSKVARACEQSGERQCEFVCKAVDAHASDSIERSVLFKLESVGTPTQPAWLIRS